MMMRILLAGLLGAVAMFIWSFVAHMVLPLGEMGVSEIPNESSVLSALQSNIGNRAGFYFFPGSGLGPEASHQQRKEAMEKNTGEYENKPTGVLIYRPPGRPFAFGKWLLREFIFQLVESTLAAFLLSWACLASFGKRVVFVAVIGIIAAITTNMSYWNWYGFPKVYTMGYMTTQFVGFVCAGIVIALVLKNPARPTVS